MRLLEQFAYPLDRRQPADPVLCREEELAELIRVLCRRNKNSPALVGPPGEPGRGSTAVGGKTDLEPEHGGTGGGNQIPGRV